MRVCLRQIICFVCSRSPSDPDMSTDSLAPFDLTPQTEFVVSDNFTSERRILVQVQDLA